MYLVVQTDKRIHTKQSNKKSGPGVSNILTNQNLKKKNEKGCFNRD